MKNIIQSIKNLFSTSAQGPILPVMEQLTAHNSQARQAARLKTNFLAFDLKLSEPVPGGVNQWRYNPDIGVGCAATACDGAEPLLWYSLEADRGIAPSMSQADLKRLVEYLQNAQQAGWNILSWNGLGFDFEVLAAKSGNWSACADLAKDHTDLMFHIFCVKGYPVSLDTVAHGSGLPGKLDGMTGDQTRLYWQQKQYDRAIQDLTQDVLTILLVAKMGQHRSKLSWSSSKGQKQEILLRDGWKKVSQAWSLPFPDTSWMKQPILRTGFYRWILDGDRSSKKQDLPTKNQATMDAAVQMARSPARAVQITPRKPRELSEDEINSIFIQCEEQFLDLSENAQQPQKMAHGPSFDETESGVMTCPCPICRGTPNLDAIFVFRETEVADQVEDWWLEEE